MNATYEELCECVGHLYLTLTLDSKRNEDRIKDALNEMQKNLQMERQRADALVGEVELLKRAKSQST